VSADLALATGHGDVYETAGVCEPLLGAALGGLLLLLGLNLYRLSANYPLPRSVPSFSAFVALSWFGMSLAIGEAFMYRRV
jgi:hypothetical protein